MEIGGVDNHRFRDRSGTHTTNIRLICHRHGILRRVTVKAIVAGTMSSVKLGN